MIDTEVSPLKRMDVNNLRKEFRRKIKTLKSEIADRQTIKISLSTNGIGVVLSLVSCLFVVSGYLYNKFLLGALNIDVSLYFTIGDYLASSIESIRYSFVGAVIAVIIYFLGINNISRKSYWELEAKRTRKDYWAYFLVFTAILGR